MQFLFGLLGGALAVIAMSQARSRGRKPAHPPARRPRTPIAARTTNRLSAYYRNNLN